MAAYQQTHAVKRALDTFDTLLLQGHLQGCVREGVWEGRDDRVLGEPNELLDRSQP